MVWRCICTYVCKCGWWLTMQCVWNHVTLPYPPSLRFLRIPSFVAHRSSMRSVYGSLFCYNVDLIRCFCIIYVVCIYLSIALRRHSLWRCFLFATICILICLFATIYLLLVLFYRDSMRVSCVNVKWECWVWRKQVDSATLLRRNYNTNKKRTETTKSSRKTHHNRRG